MNPGGRREAKKGRIRMAILVTGGARSGKSRFAEQLAGTLGKRGLYIATMPARDDELQERVKRHRERRDAAAFPWRTVEEPLDPAKWLTGEADGPAAEDVVLIDCLTLWLTNLLLMWEHEADGDARLEGAIAALAGALAAANRPVIAVTNEVGDGIVPEYPLGRRFRDWAGWMNQRMADVCSEVFLVTAGIPVELKRIAYELPTGEAKE